VLASLGLPVEYAITNAAQFGTHADAGAAGATPGAGLKLLQVREPGLASEERRLFTQQALGLAHRYGCRVLAKSLFPGADGVHFTAAELMRLQERPKEILAAASCHSREELERAMQLELDVRGPGAGEAHCLARGRARSWMEGFCDDRSRRKPAGLRDRRPGACGFPRKPGAPARYGLAMISGSWS